MPHTDYLSGQTKQELGDRPPDNQTLKRNLLWDDYQEALEYVKDLRLQLLEEEKPTQEVVVQNVIARGYKEGWTNEEWAARQGAKLLEEACERWACTKHDNPSLYVLDKKVREMRVLAGGLFDQTECWVGTGVISEIAREEDADCLVVLFCSAEAQGFDLVEEAVTKSQKDVKRGKRLIENV